MIGLILIVIANVSPCAYDIGDFRQAIVEGEHTAICDSLDRHGKHDGKHAPKR